ncbi:MAG: transglycosylase domain-containing protein [Actinomycetota bacterium]|nr:transglycosylase domain-containing protein [Actinomycetota bacterium]
MAVLLVAATAAGGVIALLTSTRSVGDAPARAQAILAAHHAPSDDGVIPVKVGDAVIAAEDSRYYHDPALDPRGLLRTTWGAVEGNSNAGGVTIELQLAKLLYTPGLSGARAEVDQLGLAIKLDRTFTKTRILALYLDAAYFGDGAQGVTLAAHHYFGVAPLALSWAQASLLAGLVQAPSAYDPAGHLTLARQRQGQVLDRLVATNVLSRDQANVIAKEPLHPAIPFGDR